MKFLAQSPTGKMVQLGDDSRHAKWYMTTEKVSINGLKIGDEVQFTYDTRGGQFFLSTLTKSNGAVPVPEVEEEPKAPVTTIEKTPKTEVNIKPEKNECCFPWAKILRRIADVIEDECKTS